MTPISPDAIEAAAKAIGATYDVADPQNLDEGARLALEAAYPILKAQWQAEAVERVEGLKRDRMELSEKRAYDRAIDDAISAIVVQSLGKAKKARK
jgi:hypothetical protein